MTCLIPDVINHVQGLIPHSSAVFFFTTHDGNPTGRYYSRAEECAQDSQRMESFAKSRDWLISRLATSPCKAGQLYRQDHPSSATNIYEYLIRDAGRRYSLDVRVEARGAIVGILILFRDSQDRFDQNDLENIARIGTYLDHAANATPVATHDGTVTDEAMAVLGPSGEITCAGPGAHELLGSIGGQLSASFSGSRVPWPCLQWLSHLAPAPGMDEKLWNVPGGSVLVQAHQMSNSAGNKPAVGLLLSRIVPRALVLWRVLGKADLSPRALEVAFWMGLGHTHADIQQRAAISQSVMRDCVKAIYSYFDCNSRETLAERLEASAAQYRLELSGGTRCSSWKNPVWGKQRLGQHG